MKNRPFSVVLSKYNENVVARTPILGCRSPNMLQRNGTYENCPYESIIGSKLTFNQKINQNFETDV